MKKEVKKAVVAGAIFSAALNLNGCVYGPPQSDSFLDSLRDAQTVAESTEEAPEADVVLSVAEAEESAT
ncbi:MAG: hypothetical protein J6X97_00375 [Lachnospiraceae bacterium]|nr:hypothetical protein [Lachnospiraceae bacterium]